MNRCASVPAWRIRTLGVLLAVLSLAAAPGNALAGGTYTVTNTNTSGAGSFLQAVSNVNSTGSGAAANTLDFSTTVADSTITLLSASLEALEKPVAITNNSGGGVTLVSDGNVGLRASASTSLTGADALGLVVNGTAAAYGITGANTAGSSLVLDTLGANTTLAVTATGSRGAAYGLYAANNLTVGSLAGAVLSTATGTGGAAYGLYAGNGLAVTGGISGTVRAVSSGAGGQSYGILSGGALNGGNAATTLTLSGTVSASANGLAVAVASAGGMNLTVTGTLSGMDTSGGGSGYAIRAGAPDGAGGWIAGTADNSVTLASGARLVGIVDLGTGNNTLTLLGTGSASNRFLGVSSLVAGDVGGTATSWTLNPGPADAGSFGNLTVNANAALSLNENVTITGNILDNGALVFDLAADSTVGGTISGTGSLAKTGSGTLFLRGGSTYTGGTLVSGGAVNIVSDANLGDASGGLTLDGGTLRAGASLAVSRNVAVLGGGGALDNAGNALTLGGVLSGSGPLTFLGGGATLLAGNGAGYAGQALLASGALVVAASGSLGGTLTTQPGTVLGGYGTLGNLENNGLLSPGGSIGTLTVAGNYVQGSTAAYRFEIAPTGGSDRLAVGGSARLDGGLLFISAPVAYYSTGSIWTVLSAAGGQTGSFAAVAQDFPSLVLRFLPVCTASGTQAVAWRTPYAGFAANGRAASAGWGLAKGALAASGAFADAILAFDLASPQAIAGSLDRLHPEPYDAYTQSGFDSGRMVTASIQGRLDALRTGRTQGAFASPFGASPGQGMAGNGPPQGAPQGAPLAAQLDADTRSGVFLQPVGMTAWQDGTGGRTAYGHATWGLLGGLDRAFTGKFSAGLFGGSVGRELRLSSPASDSGHVETASLGAYSTYQADDWFVEGSLRAGLDWYRGRRTVSSPAGGLKASAAWTGWNLFAHAGAGYDWKAGGWTLGPVCSVEFARLAQDGYTESGGGPLGLRVLPRADVSLQSSLGVRLARPLEYAWGTLTPEARIAWGHEWMSGSREIVSNFRGFENTRFTTKTVPPASDWVSAGAALTVQWPNRLSVTARADADLFRQGYQGLAGSVSLRYAF